MLMDVRVRYLIYSTEWGTNNYFFLFGVLLVYPEDGITMFLPKFWLNIYQPVKCNIPGDFNLMFCRQLTSDASP
jgi:hypothetical protein